MSSLQLNPLESPTTSPSRSGGRHQVKRSLTELASPAKLYRHHSHRSDRQQQQQQQQQHDDKTAQPNSSSMQARYSLDNPRSEGVTPIMSPDQSRRASVLVQREGDDKADSRANKEEMLPREEETSLSTDDLRQSLQELNTFATVTTQRLDETYYAVLEKMSALRNTVMALKDLAESSRDIQVGFERVAQELEIDITKQLRAVGKFEGQQSTIEALQARIHHGREKMGALATRVDVVQERVEGWERADKAWRDRTRKRLRIIWTFLSILILLVIILSITVDYSSEAIVRGDPEAHIGRRNETSEFEPHNQVKHSHHVAKDDGETDEELVWAAALDDGERLRVFDEL